MSCSGDIVVTSIGTEPHLECLSDKYFSVNFHFLNNDKSCNRDFFTIDTIDGGLSFHGIRSPLSTNIL
jgi:hypothetical protein